MDKSKLNLVDFNDKIQRDIKGGFEGLKRLFESYFSAKKNNENWVFDEVDFEKFVNGKPIIILGCNVKHDSSEAIHFSENNNKIEPYNFSDFYEKHFKFEYLGHPFSSRCDVLQGVINNLEEAKSNFSENEFATFIISTLMFLENEIKKSNKCKKIDNPKLFENLTYMKNGYIEIYNKAFDLFSHYIPNFLKVDFKKNVVSEISTTKEKKKCDEKKLWFQVGFLFAKGDIQEFKKKNDGISFNKIAEHFGNLSYETYIKATIQNYTSSNGDKNIYANLNKMNCIVNHCKSNDIKLCDEFSSKHQELLEKQY